MSLSRPGLLLWSWPPALSAAAFSCSIRLTISPEAWMPSAAAFARVCATEAAPGAAALAAAA